MKTTERNTFTSGDFPKETANYFNEITEFKKMLLDLSNNELNLIGNLVLDLTDQKEKDHCGFFLTMLLEKNNISVSQLANYVYAYSLYKSATDSQPDAKTINTKAAYKSAIEKMCKTDTFDSDNFVVDFICKFFSISRDVLKRGYGIKYELDRQGIFEFICENNATPETIIEDEWQLSIENAIDQKSKDDFIAYVTSSEIAFDEIITNSLDSVSFLTETEYSLFNVESICLYFNELTKTTRSAVFNLLKNMIDLKKSNDD